MGNSHPGNEGNAGRITTADRIRFANKDLIPVGRQNQELEERNNHSQDFFGLTKEEERAPEAAMIKMGSAIRKESIKLTKVSQEEYYLTFKFDSVFDWTITVLFACQEVWNDRHVPLHFDTLPGLPHARRYKFDKGFHQEFPPNAWLLNPTLYKDSELTEAKAGYFPVVLMIETVYPTNYKGTSRKNFEFTYGRLERDNDLYTFHWIKQRFLYGRKAFDLGEIYKVDGDSGNFVETSSKLCIVWFENREDTLALPWRHLCLCSDWSLRINETTKLCPYWRAKVTTFVHLKDQSLLVRKATLSKK